MNDCNLKWLIIFICIFIILIGLYLAFVREKKNINNGNIDIQEGGANIKTGSLNFKFAIGLSLIVIGLGSAIYSSKNLQGCGDQKHEEKDGSLKQKIHFDESQTQINHPVLNIIKKDKIYVSTSKGNLIKISGLRKEEQNILKLKGYYRFHTSGNVYPTSVGINIYSDDNLIKSFDIVVDINKDIKFEQTIFINDAQSNSINLQLQLQGMGLFDASDYLEFKNGMEITLNN